MRMLFCADAPWSPTGYGVQARSLLPRLARLSQFGGKENIGVFAFFGLQGAMMEIGGFRVYPHGGGDHGQDLIGLHAKHFGADVVVTLVDAWTQPATARKVAPARWYPWIPIDSDPVPERTLAALEGAAMPLVYARFGEAQLRAAGVPCRYIPHGVEPAVFQPDRDGERLAATRAAVGGSGCEHLTVMVAANISGALGGADRKAFALQMRGWARFAADKPGARLYIHADPLTHYGGVDLRALAEQLGIAGRVRFADPYQYFIGYSARQVAAIYQAADVCLAATMTEGFGLPIIEAQACGTPVVVTDYASMPELVVWGERVPPADLYWAAGLNTWWSWPDWRGIAKSLEVLYQQQRAWSADDWTELMMATSSRIHREYGWDAVVERYWRPLVEEWAA